MKTPVQSSGNKTLTPKTMKIGNGWQIEVNERLANSTSALKQATQPAKKYLWLNRPMQQFRKKLWWSRPITHPLQMLQWNVRAGMYFRQLAQLFRSSDSSSDSGSFSSTRSVTSWSSKTVEEIYKLIFWWRNRASPCFMGSVWPSRFIDDLW